MFNFGKSNKAKKENVENPQQKSVERVSEVKKQEPSKPIHINPPITSKPQTNSRMTNIIGKDTEIEGTIKSKGQIQILGKFKGTINSEDKLIIGESAEVESEIFCKDVELAGYVTGNVKARGKVTIKPTARVKGDVRYYEIEIEKGANISCTISRMNPENTQQVSKSEVSKPNTIKNVQKTPPPSQPTKPSSSKETTAPKLNLQ